MPNTMLKPHYYLAVLLFVVTAFLLSVVPIKAKSALGSSGFSAGVELKKVDSKALTLLEKSLSYRLAVLENSDVPEGNLTITPSAKTPSGSTADSADLARNQPYPNNTGTSPQNTSVEPTASSSPQTTLPTTSTHNSKGPLDWGGIDPNGLSRKDHIRRHDVDDPSRNTAHGVFNENSVNQTASAWQQAKELGIQPKKQGNRLIYDVPTPNAGVQGGNPSISGHGQQLNTVRIVIEAGSNRVITSFPK